MGRGDNRRTPKMKRRRAQVKLKARQRRRLDAARAAKKREGTRRGPDSAQQGAPAPIENVPRYVTADDLIAAVSAVIDEARPIAWSPDIRREFARLGLATGERTQDPDAPRNGAPFEAADHAACREGHLQKWRRNGNIGWSPSALRDPTAYARALELAATSGHRRLDYTNRRWQALRYDAATGAWVVD